MKTGRIVRIALGATALLFAVSINVPEVLAFPYHAKIGRHGIYSERPIGGRLVEVLALADARVADSPIAEPDMGRRIFLTDGGWRWRLLALTSASAFAISRPIGEPIVVNSSDIDADVVRNGQAIAGSRSLSGTLAHEMTHGLIRHHFGLLADSTYPTWLREGYCDYVAGGGSLSDAEAAALERQGKSVPALAYYRGRKRVAKILQANGGSVDKLFATAR